MAVAVSEYGDDPRRVMSETRHFRSLALPLPVLSAAVALLPAATLLQRASKDACSAAVIIDELKNARILPKCAYEPFGGGPSDVYASPIELWRMYSVDGVVGHFDHP